jgi:multidrug efflux pump subunit AcrA (membrane-fusion protein)
VTTINPSATAALPTPIVLHQKAGTTLHAQLLRVISSQHDADVVRAELRRVVKDLTGATCVVHLAGDEHGQFSSDRLESEGDIYDATEPLLTAAAVALGRSATQIKSLPNQTQLLCAPVSLPGGLGEVLAIITPEPGNIQSALYTIELAASYQRLWARGNIAVANTWKLNSLAAIVELVTSIQQQKSVAAAANTAVNHVARYLGCDRVALATVDGHDLTLQAISDMQDFDTNSETVMVISDAFGDCQVRDDICRWPPQQNKASALLGLQSLARQWHFDSVLAAPLKTVTGNTVGFWLFADSGDLVAGERFGNFVRAASPRVAGAIEIVDRSSQGLIAKTKASCGQLLAGRKGKVVLAVLALLVGLMFMPVPYRVRCQCVIEPVARRFAVAPFGGTVDEGLVEAGDVVTAGTPLANMDGRELKWELSAAQAKRGQVEKQREVDLSARDVPKVLISQLEADELDAQIDVLRYRAAHLQVTSPVDGIVLSSSLEKGQSAPVATGDVLYEIGPLDQLRVEIEVPSGDVPQIREGQRVKVWINGLEGRPIAAQIQQLQPRSELRQDRNVFIAKVTIDNPDKTFRPGMRGTARITGPRRPLAWNLFHKPWEYAVSRMTWW